MRQSPLYKHRLVTIGALVWLSTLQYFIFQPIVAAAWKNPTYNWFRNVISDLGNNVCGQYYDRLVCSPLHPLMNMSFIALGAATLIGSFCFYKTIAESRTAKLAFVGLMLDGMGTILVGLYPENTVRPLHALGAALVFVVGNFAVLVLSRALRLSPPMRMYTRITGSIALVAFVLYVSGMNLGLGQGGMERLTAYPQTVWQIVFGIYVLRRRQLKRSWLSSR